MLHLPQNKGADANGIHRFNGHWIKEHREWAPSASAALLLIREHMKLRPPGVRRNCEGCVWEMKRGLERPN